MTAIADPVATLLPTLEPIRILAPDGTLQPHADFPLDLPDADLQALYRHMAVTRRLDREAVNLQRQGQVGAYPPGEGQEAAQVGSAYALRPQDWVFPAYRELGAAVVRGLPPAAILHLFRGTWHSAHDPYAHNYGLLTLPIGTQTLHATGFALGMLLDGKDVASIVYLGDGATSEGDPHEAFNFAAVFRVPLVFCVQNNQYAISVPVARQTRAPSIAHKGIGYGMPGVRVDGNDVLACYTVTRAAIERARAGDGPTLIEAVTYRVAPHSTADDPTRYQDAAEREHWLALDPIARMEAFLRARDLFDLAFTDVVEAEAEQAVAAMREAIHDAPVGSPLELFEHVYRQPPPIYRRQRAQLAAELEAAAEGEPCGVTLAQALNRALADAMESDPRVLVFGEDVGRLGGVFRITDGLQSRFGARRCFDTPLAEAGILGTSLGLALAGWRPVPEIQFEGFAYPGFEQLFSHIAKYQNRSRGALKMPVTVRIPFGGGIGGAEHHGESPEAYFAHTAGLKVVAPSTPADAYSLLRESIALDDPVVFLEPKQRYWSKQDVELPTATEPLGRAVVRRAGRDVTVVAYGPTVRTALEAAEIAAGAEGWGLEVVDLRSLVPLDEETLLASVRKTGRCIVVHEAQSTLGFGAELAALVQEFAFYHLQAPVLRVTGFDTPYPPVKLERHWLPDAERVLDAVARSLAY